MYTIKLQEFEGPLDLLLFFIKRDELDIYDIPISRITREFLEYIHYMETLDLDVAGEFLVMAAELMQIKVRMLLPPEPGEEEDVDPRANLVKRLVEYKRFKEVASDMSRREEERRKIFSRGYFDSDPKVMTEDEEENLLRDVSLFDLIASFKFAIERMPKKFVHEIQKLNVSIELVKDMEEKIRVVVTFMALLELIRAGKIIVRQPAPFAEVSILRNVN